jgi:hypothetical protein
MKTKHAFLTPALLAIFTTAAFPADAPPAALTPDQNAALNKMVQLADAQQADLVNLAMVRTQTPEFWNLQLEAFRTGIGVHLLQNPPADQRKKLLDAYAQRARQTEAEIIKRTYIDASTADIRGAHYQVLEADAFCAGLTPRFGFELPTMPQPMTDKKLQTICSDMAETAKDVNAGLKQLSSIRSRTPEFLQTQQQWQWRLLEARLLAVADPAERKKAAQDYLDAARALQKDAEDHIAIDATKASLELAKFAVARGEFVLASLDAPPGARELTDAQRKALENLLTIVQAHIQGITDLEMIRPKTPEFMQLKLDAYRRRMEIQLALAKPEDRKPLVEQYQKTLADIAAGMPQVNDPSAYSLRMAQFAQAYADYLKACLK